VPTQNLENKLIIIDILEKKLRLAGFTASH